MIPGIEELEGTLIGGGLTPGAGADAARRILRSAAIGRSARKGDVDAEGPAAGFFVPGRVEIVGKHTDYAGGRSLTAALEAGISTVVLADSEPRVLVIDTDTGNRASFPHGVEIAGESGGEWSRYPGILLQRIRSDLPSLGGAMEGGAVVALSSSLPRAAGMSSSSALLVALHLALAVRYRWGESEGWQRHLGSREAVAGYLAAVEAGREFLPGRGRSGPGHPGGQGIGTRGGAQDHLAILCGRAGHAVGYAYAPTRFEGEVPLPAEWTFALAASGASAPKAGAAGEAYNRLSAQVEAVMDLWRGARAPAPEPHLGAILDGPPSHLVHLGRILRDSRHLRFSPDELLRRTVQFVDECTLHVPGARDALLQNDVDAFGRYVEASFEAGRDALANHTPETDRLTAIARDLGSPAASPFGAGFGGSVWAFVREEESADFLDRWRSRYLEAFPDRADHARFLRSRAGPGALRVF